MKARDVSYRIKLGAFIIVATMLLTALIIYIGSNRYFLWRGKDISAVFTSIHGLKEGNAVRYSGVHVGTVRKIEILSDSAVIIYMTVDSETMKFIKKDSKVSIGTEGLIGSKYVKISPGSPNLSSIEPGDKLPSEEAVDLEELLTTVSETTTNAKDVSENLEKITEQIKSGEGLLGALLTDPKMEYQVRETFNSFHQTGENSRQFSKKMVGVAGSLQTTGEKAKEISDEIHIASENLVTSSETMMTTTENLYSFSDKLNSDTNNLGRLISDTSLAWQLEQDLIKIGMTADDIRETSCRVRNAWFIRLFSKKRK